MLGRRISRKLPAGAENRHERRPDPPLRALRVDARRALSAHAPARGLRLGHRRLLLPRHHARRRDADHRALGDERLRRAPQQDRRHQRTHLHRRARQAAHRLCRALGAPLEGGRHPPRDPARRGPGLRLLALQRQRRARARGADGGPRQDRGGLGEPAPGQPRGELRQGGGIALGKRLAEQLALQVGDTITLATPKGAQGPFGVAPRIKGYQVDAIFELGMSEFDADLRLHAARGGAGLFQPRGRRDRDRGLPRQRRPRRRGARRDRDGGRAGGGADRLAPAQPHLLSARSRSSATSCSSS